ncbi:unnamed protein product [Thlaspi arvense]|uniref:HMA domain-containing protein n=1 Tax=Thlaspi arvense TaxID=13288 RepID=A0AAU9SXZ4_THLAR|nr:unnamed protein product [Thlaspi arvense]
MKSIMASKNEKKMTKSYFDVLGICCTSEVPLIENILKSLDGIKEYSVIVPSRTVIVVHDSLIISQFHIVKALNQARLEANVRVTGETNFKNKWPSPFAVVSGLLFLLSFFKYVYSPFRWLAVAAVVAGIYPILAKSVASIARCRFDINILVTKKGNEKQKETWGDSELNPDGVGATLCMRDYTEAAAVVFLFTIAEWLQSRASYKASAVMQSLMSLAPQKAVIAETGEEVEVDELKINTVIAVKAGETIPIDGLVVDGNCEVDEKTLTGEAFPVAKLRDSTVWAGTINLNGYITVKTTALAEDCVVAKMAKLVEEAQNSKTETQRFIDECSKYYTPAVIIISICFAVIPYALKVHNPKHWFHLALVVLVSACPCGLILSTPVATFCALTKAATSGLLIKGADCLETLAKIKTVAFDKTGTITRGEFVVMDFKVSSAESKSSHPMASALVDYAKSVSVEPKPEAVEDYQNFPGEGIYGKIDGKEVYIGNKRIASRAGCSSVPDIDVDTKGGKTVGYVYVGETLAGVFNLSDACRSGVAQAMKELKSLGIKTAMLTGDNQAAAMHAQEQLGNAMDVVRAELLPQGKSEIIREFKREGPTAMVGDGLNDAPALATADIGVSMGIYGSALATETGNIILMSNDIRRIPQAIRLARRAKRKVVENVILSITMKGAILALAFAGHPLIWAAVLADVGTCLLVILNSMLLLRDTHTAPVNKCHRASSPSVLNAEKHGGDVAGDMEAGLLPKSSDGHCKSGCCGKKKNLEKVMKPARTSSDHSHSGCCDEKQKDIVVIKKCCAAEPRDLEQGIDSGCCGNKIQRPHLHEVKQTCHNKPGDSEEIVLDVGDGDCKSVCCGTGSVHDDSSNLANLDEEVKVSVKSCCSKPVVPVVASLKVKSDVHCESRCCESSKKDKEETCSEVKTKEASKTNCSSREGRHIGGSCGQHPTMTETNQTAFYNAGFASDKLLVYQQLPISFKWIQPLEESRWTLQCSFPTGTFHIMESGDEAQRTKQESSSFANPFDVDNLLILHFLQQFMTSESPSRGDDPVRPVSLGRSLLPKGRPKFCLLWIPCCQASLYLSPDWSESSTVFSLREFPFLGNVVVLSFSSSSDGVPDLDSVCISIALVLGPPDLKPLALGALGIKLGTFGTGKSLGRDSISIKQFLALASVISAAQSSHFIRADAFPITCSTKNITSLKKQETFIRRKLITCAHQETTSYPQSPFGTGESNIHPPDIRNKANPVIGSTHT